MARAAQPATLTEEERWFLAENPFVGVVTDLRPDGSPHSTVVWVDAEDGGVSFNTARGRAKERYLGRDPRVSLLVVDPNDPFRWVAVSGRAELTDDGADEQIDELAKKYLGQERYPWRRPEERRISVKIALDRIDSTGFDT
jgi:PPOX class probable F420-dependent enzyme